MHGEVGRRARAHLQKYFQLTRNVFILVIVGGGATPEGKTHRCGKKATFVQTRHVPRDVALRQAVVDHPDFNTMSLSRRREILAQQMGHVRPEMRASAIELASRPEFIRATTTGETPNRTLQMELGLERAGYLPAISFDAPVMRATFATEVQSIIRDPSLSAAELGSFESPDAIYLRPRNFGNNQVIICPS